jgi:hypothetical protein
MQMHTEGYKSGLAAGARVAAGQIAEVNAEKARLEKALADKVIERLAATQRQHN